MTLSRYAEEMPQSPVDCTYRAITLWQPWASLVALGLKRFETRSWSTNYRGKLLIHAAKRAYGMKSQEEEVARLACDLAGIGSFDRKRLDFLGQLHPSKPSNHLPLGAIVAVADLTACQKMWSKSQLPSSPMWADDVRENDTEILIDDQTELERAVGDWQPGRYAWKLENIQALKEPIYCKGAQGLWIPSDEIIKAVRGAA